MESMSEKLFSDAMIESMPGIAYFYTEAGRFLRWNRNFVSVSGCSPEQIAQSHPLDFFAGKDKRLVAQRIREVFERGESSVEADFVSRDGRVTPYFFTGRRVMFEGSACLVGVGVDITERRRSEVALREYAGRLQALSRKLIEVQENERRTLARELHDTVGQELTALSLNLIMMRAAIPAQLALEIGQRLEDSEALLQETTQHIRHVMVELRPAGIDELGLLAALKEHATRVARRGGLSIVVRGVEPKPRLPPTVEMALFRIAQEALNNTVKHAQASEASIELQAERGSVVLTVTDNGKGFDARPERGNGLYGMGMTTMRERAELIGWSFQVQTGSGQGTRVSAATTAGV